MTGGPDASVPLLDIIHLQDDLYPKPRRWDDMSRAK
jgi:hypothetical protein